MRGSTHDDPLDAIVEAGAIGFKIHEDYGAYPAIIDHTLAYADRHDVSVSLHTDGLHESAELEDTVAAIAGRTVHAYHVEGAGGGHVPDLLGLVREPSVICSSTTPTIPYGVAAPMEHLPMTMLNHGTSFARAGRRCAGPRADPSRHDGCRRPASRARCDRDRQLRLAGHGPDRRDPPAHHAACARDAGVADLQRPERAIPVSRRRLMTHMTTRTACCNTWPR